MHHQDLVTLSEEWSRTVADVKARREVNYERLLFLFRETHKHFVVLRDRDTLPRIAFQIVMQMDEFTYYATMTEESGFDDNCSALYYLNYALKQLFFGGDYRSEFFLGPDPAQTIPYTLNLEQLSPSEFTAFLKDAVDTPYNTLLLSDPT